MRAFVTVVESGGFTAAARQLHRSPGICDPLIESMVDERRRASLEAFA
ncbi:helix-turn-helix domain-containing protein [Burkholderia aenigmatica]|nr:LysR family transcriptional regulator [Burkholderia aenigmatica]MDN7880953.1 LysR family transcriptional regulator [Burkholderia aenigmatica]